MSPRDTAVSHADKNDFDFIEGIYDLLGIVGFLGDIHRAQVALLPEVANIESALVIGGGTGRFLLDLLARTSVKRVVYIEKSGKMLQRSRERLASKYPHWLSRVDFRHGTEESLTPADGKFSLIAAHFFLSCFDDEGCARMIARLDPWLAPDGRWLFSDFHVPEGDGWRAPARVMFRMIYGFFNVVSNLEAKLPPRFEQGFERAGLTTLIDRPFHCEMIRAKLLAHT